MKKIIFFLLCSICYSNVALANNPFYVTRWWRTATIEDVHNELERGNSIFYLRAGLNLAFLYSKNTELHKGLVEIIRDVNDESTAEELGRILIIAVQKNLGRDLIETIINANADLNIKLSSDDGYTPLMYAVSNGNKEVVKLLLQANADVDVQSSKRQATALMFAAAYDQEGKIVQMLIDAKANPYLVNRNNRNALNMAYDFNANPKIAEMIKHYMKEYKNKNI